MVDDRGEVVEVDSRRRISGDGTVPYFSLSWCHHWLGGIANITYAPQENYPQDDVKTWDNMEVKTFNREHRQPDQLGRPMNAFFEMRSDATADGELDTTTEVWEIDGVRHKVMSPFIWPAASEVVCAASREVGRRARPMWSHAQANALKRSPPYDLLDRNPCAALCTGLGAVRGFP